MAERVLLLQSAPGAATLTEVGQADTTGLTILSSITVCNRSATPTSFRIAITPAGGAVADSSYLYYDTYAPGQETLLITSGIALPPSAIIRVYATLATLTFTFSLLKRT